MEEKIQDGIVFQYYDDTDSTNRIALEKQAAPHLFTVIAETQSGGRGRMGRKYFSYSGGLYMSIVLDTDKINVPLNLCTPCAALAVYTALRECGINDIKIKWVNDIYKNSKKICGILTECRSDKGKIEKIVVGIGINLTEPEGGFPDDIKNKAGCAGYTGEKHSLALSIVKKLDKYIKLQNSEVVAIYESNMAFLGERAVVTDYADGNKKICGTIIGVNNDCFLKIALDDGTERLLSSGEII